MSLLQRSGASQILRAAPRCILSRGTCPWAAAAAASSEAAAASKRQQTRQLSQTCTRRPNIYSNTQRIQYQRRTLFGGHVVIRDYVDLPSDYKDKKGLAFRSRDLEEDEIPGIFGPDTALTAPSANHLLRILHGRRVAGTLEDPGFAHNTAQFDEGDVAAALGYLRKTVRVDEVVNAGLRAEDELAELEEAEHRRELDKALTGKEDVPTEAEEQAIEVKDDPLYGRSRFAEMRARNEARDRARAKAQQELEQQREAEALRRAVEGASSGEGGVVVYDRHGRAAHSLVEVGEGERPITNPRIAEYYRAAMSDETDPTPVSLWRRVWPSAVAWVAGVGLMAGVCAVYETPEDRDRLFPQVSAATATVGALVGVNLVVFVAWRVPPLWRVLNRYMVMVVGRPRPVSLLTAVFSHREAKHLAVNMAALAAGGMQIHDDLGRMGYLALFLGCGSAGFLGSLIVYGARGMLGVATMGSSAGCIGVLAAYFWLHRDDRFRVPGMPVDQDVHGIVWWALIVAYYVYEGFSVFALRNRSDVVSHWAGLLAGMAGIHFMERAGMVEGKGEKKEEK